MEQALNHPEYLTELGCVSINRYSDSLDSVTFVFHSRLGEAVYSVCFTFAAGLVTGWSLAFLAFERYIVICKPFGNFRFSSKHALMVVLVTWIIGIGVSIPPFFGWSR